jgi:hypothetical protein
MNDVHEKTAGIVEAEVIDAEEVTLVRPSASAEGDQLVSRDGRPME